MVLTSFFCNGFSGRVNRPVSSLARNSTSANNTPLQHSPQFGQSFETVSVGLPALIARAYNASGGRQTFWTDGNCENPVV